MTPAAPVRAVHGPGRRRWDVGTRLLPALVIAGFLGGCAGSLRGDPDDLCDVYREKPGWYKASVKSARRWGGPIPVAMAIMHQESLFKARARPPMRFFLGFIPYGRASNAYGYAQALDSTWAAYRREAGSMLSRRNRFTDAIDFIQWYMRQTRQINRIAKSDAYAHYLNYHEGQGGYAAGSYKTKAWLMDAAARVQARADKYASQYASCKRELERGRSWWFLF